MPNNASVKVSKCSPKPCIEGQTIQLQTNKNNNKKTKKQCQCRNTDNVKGISVRLSVSAL